MRYDRAMTERPLKVLIAKPGLDGHDRAPRCSPGACVTRARGRYTGLPQTPEMIPTAAPRRMSTGSGCQSCRARNDARATRDQAPHRARDGQRARYGRRDHPRRRRPAAGGRRGRDLRPGHEPCRSPTTCGRTHDRATDRGGRCGDAGGRAVRGRHRRRPAGPRPPLDRRRRTAPRGRRSRAARARGGQGGRRLRRMAQGRPGRASRPSPLPHSSPRSAARSGRWRSSPSIVEPDQKVALLHDSGADAGVRRRRRRVHPLVGVARHAGGLASTSTAGGTVLDAAGFDLILIETVGTGQSEVEVAAAADATVVLEAPEMGERVKAIKASLLEVADLVHGGQERHSGRGPQRTAAQCTRCLRSASAPRDAAGGGRSPGPAAAEATGGPDHDRCDRRRRSRAARRAGSPPRGRAGAERRPKARLDPGRGAGLGDRVRAASRAQLGDAGHAAADKRPPVSLAEVTEHGLDPYAAADRLLETLS